MCRHQPPRPQDHVRESYRASKAYQRRRLTAHGCGTRLIEASWIGLLLLLPASLRPVRQLQGVGTGDARNLYSFRGSICLSVTSSSCWLTSLAQIRQRTAMSSSRLICACRKMLCKVFGARARCAGTVTRSRPRTRRTCEPSCLSQRSPSVSALERRVDQINPVAASRQLQHGITLKMQSDLARRGSACKMAPNRFLNCVSQLRQIVSLCCDSPTLRVVPRGNQNARFCVPLNLKGQEIHWNSASQFAQYNRSE